jgi:hypothetical protein
MKYVGWSWLYFYAYISMAVIVLLNLVTAIIVDNAMKNSQMDVQHALAEKENDKKKLLAQFRALFELMDEDGDGQLTWTEFENAFEVPEVATKLKMLDFEPESCRELFHLLDSGDGSLTLDEFFEGIASMDGNAKAKDSFKLLKVTNILQRSLQQLANDIQEDNRQLLQHTPGCHVATRLGSLRGRSRNNDDSSVISSPTRHRLDSSARGQEPPPEPPSGPGSPLLHREWSVEGDDALSPALGSLRKLPPCPVFAAVTRECSVGNDGDISPALAGDLSPAKRRSKQLGTAATSASGVTSESAALMRVHEVSEQVTVCNLKVDALAENIASLQASMKLVLQSVHPGTYFATRENTRTSLASPPEIL